MHQLVIANRLGDGIVVFLGKDGKWVEMVGDCEPAPAGAEAEALLEKALADERDRIVVGPILADVEKKDGTWVPTKRREAIRAAGPTIRKDLGKQAGN